MRTVAFRACLSLSLSPSRSLCPSFFLFCPFSFLHPPPGQKKVRLQGALPIPSGSRPRSFSPSLSTWPPKGPPREGGVLSLSLSLSLFLLIMVFYAMWHVHMFSKTTELVCCAWFVIMSGFNDKPKFPLFLVVLEWVCPASYTLAPGGDARSENSISFPGTQAFTTQSPCPVAQQIPRSPHCLDQAASASTQRRTGSV